MVIYFVLTRYLSPVPKKNHPNDNQQNPPTQNNHNDEYVDYEEVE